MAINISINKTLVFMIQSKIIHITVFSTKKKINIFDIQTFIQMRADENKFWQIRNTSGNGNFITKNYIKKSPDLS